MADKGDKDDGKPSLSSNPFLLPSISSASQTSRRTQSSNVSRPYGTMTSSTSTVARNIFSSSSGVMSTSSRTYPVTSLPSGAFGASAFRSFESSGSFTTTSTCKSSGFFGTDPHVVKSGAYTFPVFGGVVKEKSEVSRSALQTGRKNPGYEQKYPSQSDHELRKTIAPYGPRSSTSSKANMVLTQSFSQSKVGPTVFGELPGNKSSPSNMTSSESVSTFTSPHTSNVFGGKSVTCQSKEEKSMDSSVIETNVFIGASSISPFQLPVSGHYSTPALFVTSSNASDSSPSLFGGLSTSSVPKSTSSTTITPTVFGGGISSVISPDVTTQHGSYGTTSVSNLFGGKVEKTIGSMITVPSSASTVFGGSEGFSSVPSPMPRLFGGIPSNPLVSGISGGTGSSGVNDIPMVMSSAEFIPGPHSETPVCNPFEKASDSPMTGTSLVPNVFDVSNTDPLISDMLTTTTTPNLSDEMYADFPIIEPLENEGLSISTEVTKTSDNITSSGSSTPFESGENKQTFSTEGFTTSTYVFGGPTTDASHIPKLFSGDIFGGIDKSLTTTTAQPNQEVLDSKLTSENLMPIVTSESVLEGSNVVVSSQSSIATTLFGGTISKEQKKDIVVTESKSGEQEKEEPKSQVERSSLKDPVSVTESSSERLEREKQLEDLLSTKDLMSSKDLIDNILGKSDAKLTPASTPASSPPQYEKKELTKIIVAQIPDSCMDRDIIKSHFQKFGHVKRVYLNPKSNQATVQYEDHKGASRAKRKGQKIHPKLSEVKIFYATPVRRKSEDSTIDAILSKKKAIKTLQQNPPVSDVRPPSDIDPYTPLERPSVSANPPSFLSKHSKREIVSASRSWRTSKVSVDEKSKSKVSKEHSTFLSSYRVSPRPVPKAASPKISRMESPKPLQLKKDDKLKTSSRPVSPARDYNVFTEIKNLKAAVESRSLNSGDKFNVLKARDKLVRNERKKTLDIKKATSLDAVCPDMCPELERYMRDVQNDLSSYEVTNGILDHNLCIKKFSRSSADKDEPLPHELRPGPVLLKTMDFLVCNIMVLSDRKDIDIGIWYNYLWDRTRAIRSDITQQQLTDTIAVTIIERCVRFHIYTDVHLCEESPDVFDRKLNTENLTKSLQTLKELYKDLAEMGKYFPSEAEFRAYEMLLNLNDGEKIVHQYSQYRDEVQKSSDVIYALKIFLALKNHNFARFFKLIRSCTYLQGCISHRYFPQVRSEALDIYVKAYVVSKRVKIPLVFMIKSLGFEDRADAVSYLNYHGIVVDDQDVIIDKILIDLHPEGQPPVRRPVKLIESNRLFSVGEVIQGGQIPENPLHTYIPHDSFDEDGYLRGDARDASDQQKKLHSLLSGTSLTIGLAPKEPLTMPAVEQPVLSIAQEPYPPTQSQLALQEPKGLSDHDYMTFLKDTYDRVSASVVSSLTGEVVKEAIETVKSEQIQKTAVKSISHELLSECVKREAKIIGKDAYNEVDVEEKERKRREKEEAKMKVKLEKEMRHYISTSVCEEYTTEFIASLLKQLCQESISEVERELLQEVHANLMKDLPAKLVKEVVHEEVSKLGSEVISEITLELEEKIEQLQQKMTLRKMRVHFRKWRKLVLRLRRCKQAQETFPASFSQLSLQEQNEAFSWGYNRKSSENMSAEHLMKLEVEDAIVSEKMIIRDQLVRTVAWYPLPIQQEMKKMIESSPQVNNLLKHYFKVLLCTDIDDVNSMILQWLRSKLIGVENADVLEQLDYSFSFKSKLTNLEYGFSFHEASLHSLTAEDFKGTSAILFITKDLTTQNPGYKDIQSLIRANPKINYKVISEKKSSAEESWELREEDILVPETSQKLMNLVIEMWEKHTGRIQVVSSRLNNFVSGLVASRYIQPSLLKQRERCDDRKSPLSPETYINLYNAVVQDLIEMIDDDELSRLDWPPPELSHLEQIPPPSWNTSDIKSITNIVEQLKLPVLDIDGFMTWKEIVNTLYEYVGQISQPEVLSLELWSHITCLLNNTSKILESTYNLDFGNPDLEIHILHLPWTELIYACVSYKLSHLTDSPVFYQPKRLNSFACPQDWWEACDYSDPFWNETSYEKGVLNSRKRKVTEDDEILHKQAKVPMLSSELLIDIAREKERYLEFERKLQSALEDDESVPFWNESVNRSDLLDSGDCGAVSNDDELSGQEEEPVICSELLNDIAKEKQKCEMFQKKLESMLGDGEELRFLFKE